jgi:hypothetical protein
VCHDFWYQFFTGIGFWSTIEHALFLCWFPV